MEYTEEEKQAIETMTKIRDINLHTFVNELTIVLNLIEKQQKEIENLKKITQTYDSFPKYNMKDNILLASPDYFQNGTFVKKFIPKEAIRESLRGINRNIASAKCGKDENYIYAKRILEELLGE